MIELPVYEVTLPVSGKRIEVSPLVVKEEKIIIAARDTGQKSDSYLTFLKMKELKTIKINMKKLNLICLNYSFSHQLRILIKK